MQSIYPIDWCLNHIEAFSLPLNDMFDHGRWPYCAPVTVDSLEPMKETYVIKDIYSAIRDTAEFKTSR